MTALAALITLVVAAVLGIGRRRADFGQPPIDLWAPEWLGRFALGMLAQQADILDQVATAAHQARQLTTVTVAPAPRREDRAALGEACQQPPASKDQC
jgi:hypothetical protein